MSHVTRIELGGIVVDVLCDAVGDHPRALPDAFPGAPALGWDAVRNAFPATVGVEGRWRFGTHVLLVRTPDARVLVDAGVGPAGTAAADWLHVTGTLDADLAALEVRPEDIDVLVLTHLHQDHIGWLVEPGTRTPRFARARHVLSEPEWTSVQDAMPAHLRDTFEPVQAADLLDVGGDLVDGLALLPLPGHTPGHSGVLIEGEERRLLFGGDAFNHPLQIDDPGVPSLADADREQAVATRHEVLALARGQALTVLGAHLPGALWPERADAAVG
ncbi:MBL fold metallo-hydrolase [Solirubrobacter sp. CPCC 204708]|uniref:MBL fold metallo-hydrolase n=1 Tax=Solirubrobacter deserti TaxID=2282478 RepID=A0ABT4RQ42_9ACTN|nr:MBL fold metallo-hydrolase [Solirubrobacter deserti]MBE2320639.1 MBL fold metallo-hydrolase [Solirubrobacter deserti]MDA0140693.1 MBL fold metallo-hydrolase [Solirubrobacter deserti]